MFLFLIVGLIYTLEGNAVFYRINFCLCCMEINFILPWNKDIFETQVHNIGKEFKQRWNALRIGKWKTLQKCLYISLVTYKQLTNQLTNSTEESPPSELRSSSSICVIPCIK
jgi:hypothetical protein